MRTQECHEGTKTQSRTNAFVSLRVFVSLWQLILVITVLFFLSGCRQKSPYEKETALLDSVKIVLQVKLNELKKAETNVQNTGFSKYEIYSRFLSGNLKDTIEKSQANAVRSFINSGKTVSSFNKTKPDLIRETEKTISQLQKLSSDLKEENIQPNAVRTYFDTETSHADKLITTIEQNIKSVNIGLINFRNAVPRTEELIKQINNGQLPTVVADTTSE
jgi:hypothetical protein